MSTQATTDLHARWWRITLAVCLLSLALIGLLQPVVP
jgi:hypothetical protein